MRAKYLKIGGCLLGLLGVLSGSGYAQQRDSLFRAIRAQASLSEHPGLVFLEAARGLLARGDFAGIDPYYHGLLYSDPASLAAYGYDLETIWSTTEADSLRTLRAEARGEFLRRFWLKREGPLRIPGERLIEHYRRLAYARLHFGRPNQPRNYEWWQPIQTGSREFDDRGLIYVRHGPPHEVVTGQRSLYASGVPDADATLFNAGGAVNRPGVEGLIGPTADDPKGRFVPPFEAWWYDGEPAFRIFFQACAIFSSPSKFEHTVCPPGSDYRLVESALGLLRPVPELDNGDLNGSGLADLSPTFAHALGLSRLLRSSNSVGDASAARFQVWREQVEWMSRGIETESYNFRFPTMVPGRATVETLTGSDGTLIAHVGFAEAVKGLPSRKSADGQSLYSATIRILLEDANGVTVGRRIVNRTFAYPRPLPERAYVMGLESIPLSGPASRARVIIQNDIERGMRGAVERIVVPPVDSTVVGMSALVVGTGGPGLGWGTPEDTVWFNPSAQFDQTDPLELAWEVYGIPAGETYEIDIQVVKKKTGLSRLFGGESVQIKLGFATQSPGVRHRLLRTLDASRLKPGPYIVRVQVKTLGGDAITREVAIEMSDK